MSRQTQQQPGALVPFAGRYLMTPRIVAVSGILLLAGLAVAAYLPSMGGNFILDDDLYLTNSSIIKSPDGLRLFWCSVEAIDYYPVSNSSLWIEWRLWGMNPRGYHVTNLLLHVASALLIWAILRQLAVPGAFLAALLFTVHPVNVESVAWISQRKDLLAIVFCLLSVLCYLKADEPVLPIDKIRSSQPPPSAKGSHGNKWYWLSLLMFLMAVLSKGSATILPAVLLALVWWQRRKIDLGEWLRVAPFFVISIVLTLANIWFQHRGYEADIRSASFAERCAGTGAAVWFYLSKAIVPINLAFIYPKWRVDTGIVLCWLPLGAAVIVTAVLILKRDNWWGRPLLLAWIFFGVVLIPMLGFTDVGFMEFSLVADHYQHMAIIGVLALAAAWLAWCQQIRGAAGSMAQRDRRVFGRRFDAGDLAARPSVRNSADAVRSHLGDKSNFVFGAKQPGT